MLLRSPCSCQNALTDCLAWERLTKEVSAALAMCWLSATSHSRAGSRSLLADASCCWPSGDPASPSTMPTAAFRICETTISILFRAVDQHCAACMHVNMMHAIQRAQPAVQSVKIKICMHLRPGIPQETNEIVQLAALIASRLHSVRHWARKCFCAICEAGLQRASTGVYAATCCTAFKFLKVIRGLMSCGTKPPLSSPATVFASLQFPVTVCSWLATITMSNLTMQQRLSHLPAGQCCQLSSLRQKAVLGRLRASSWSRRPATARSSFSIRAQAAATLEAPPAEAPAAPAPSDDAGEIIVTPPPQRREKKRSRRFREMATKVPLKTVALGKQQLGLSQYGALRLRLRLCIAEAMHLRWPFSWASLCSRCFRQPRARRWTQFCRLRQRDLRRLWRCMHA